MARRIVSVTVPSASVVCLVALLAAGSLVLAGDLNPPAGPVAPTMKTLDQVEPRIPINATNTPGDADSIYKITAPGSYYLTGSVTGVAAKHGIEIASSRVTIDLNGFELRGSTGSLDGISATVNNLENIEVRNGSITSWGESGIDFLTRFPRRTVIRNVRSGLNAQGGFSIGDSATIEGCTAFMNLNYGFSLEDGGVITRCAANENTGNGIDVNFGAVVTECSAYLNTQDGIVASGGSLVSRCTAYQNSGSGISILAATVSDCHARFNGVDGIALTAFSTALNNTCGANGTGSAGAGIHATLGNNRIEGNNCIGNVRNFDIDSAGNFIARNTGAASFGTVVNWDVAAGNAILIVNAATASAIFGDAGGVSPGSTNPNANYSY